MSGRVLVSVDGFSLRVGAVRRRGITIRDRRDGHLGEPIERTPTRNLGYGA